MIPWYQNLPLWVTVLPLLGALLLLFVPKGSRRIFELGALAVTVVDFLLSLPLWFQYDRASSAVQWATSYEWIPSIGVRFSIGMDGISLVLFLLTTFLGFIVVWCSFTAISERHKEYYIWLLVMQFSMMGVFITQDMFQFYLFWELMLVPMYFLIAIWGGPQKLYAAIKLFLYTLAGSVLMLVAILAIYFLQYKATGRYDMSIASFQAMAPVIAQQSRTFQTLLAVAFFLGFAIKVPMFPFHTWLPDAHVEAPTAGSVVLAGVLLKMGTYGFIRFLLPIAPDATKQLMPWFMTLALIGIIYGALVAMIQKDMKKLVAYSSVSHLGMCMLGLFALNPDGITGGILQMLNHGISTSALFLIVGIVYERRHTRLIAEYGGLSKTMPLYATVFMIMTMSSIGLPGLNGFIGELAILLGAFQAAPWIAVLATTGIILGAAYMLWLYQRAMFGPIREVNTQMKDLNARELAYFAPLIAVAFWIGIYPKPLLKVLEAPVAKLVTQVNPDFYKQKALDAAQREAAKAGMAAMAAPAEHAASGEPAGEAAHAGAGTEHGGH
ncbi:complex I subunit 4 family protein [Mesoterricola sediminis]|uniref:NADH:ubiquinone oxidoreductase subunit M n=1 Tax=Mesoterricola sediminis TaxID=2927980 RepID=A0AA48KG23_9BACT|nr:NADH-quinone oxidoreductase subunit M [Mesoterricola sediminis]BDU78862.1 NADH:ubiquinone oxidoreductase subunit M [Mesoterricola sediminis]